MKCILFKWSSPGQEGSPREGQREQDSRGWGGEPAGCEAPGGIKVSSKTLPATTSDKGNFLWWPLHVPCHWRPACTEIKGTRCNRNTVDGEISSPFFSFELLIRNVICSYSCCRYGKWHYASWTNYNHWIDTLIHNTLVKMLTNCIHEYICYPFLFYSSQD